MAGLANQTSGGGRPNRQWTLSAPGAGKGLFRPCMHPTLMCASIPCSQPPIQGACISLGGPGPMCSFSDVSEKLLQTRYTTQSVVCHDVTTGKHPCLYLLAICSPHTGKANSITPRGSNLTVTFRQGLYWLGYGWSSSVLNCIPLWNLYNIASYLKGRLIE